MNWVVEEFIWEKGISHICFSSGGGESSNNTEGHRKLGGLEGRGRGHSQTKWQHTITGTTNITDTAEGTGWGLQTQPPSILGQRGVWRERVEKGEEGGSAPQTCRLCPLII